MGDPTIFRVNFGLTEDGEAVIVLNGRPVNQATTAGASPGSRVGPTGYMRQRAEQAAARLGVELGGERRVAQTMYALPEGADVLEETSRVVRGAVDDPERE